MSTEIDRQIDMVAQAAWEKNFGKEYKTSAPDNPWILNITLPYPELLNEFSFREKLAGLKSFFMGKPDITTGIISPLLALLGAAELNYQTKDPTPESIGMPLAVFIVLGYVFVYNPQKSSG